jgi:hypothetical protein
MTRELDKNGRPYKCGPNWLPDIIFNEPPFYECCKQHDKDWEALKCKFRSDWALFMCCLRVSRKEKGWWKVRAYAQSVLMYIILLLNPLSYVIYFITKKGQQK